MMPHDHDHDNHHHDHHHTPTDFGRAFVIGIILNTVFVVVEVIYGLLAHSLALIADAGHNLSDVLGLLLAWSASSLAKRAATERHSYGLRRTSILAALTNAIFLLVSVGAIGWEAVQRLLTPEDVTAPVMIGVAAFGVVINGITAMMFMSGRKQDLNLRAAFLHMTTDALLSLGVVIAGVVIYYSGWQRADPLMSLLLVAVIIFGTWELLRDSLNLALDAVPEGIDIRAVKNYLREQAGVSDVHHLHIWGLSTTDVALTVHLVVNDNRHNDALIHKLHHELHERFGIGHATLQLESQAASECEEQDCC